ncbi:MAG: alcohol dehydrogenase catalytic domain-containing protein, partial [Hyphomicrobiales bacterium]|nr:alcohol dehydrogenase catalytic domain-containing protein [Hyphomicrobiales bacterium]
MRDAYDRPAPRLSVSHRRTMAYKPLKSICIPREDPMKAFRVSSHDTAPTIEEIDRPEPAPGEIRVAIQACGLNFADLLMAGGTYQDTPALPFTLGMEVAGTVDALGDGVSGLAVGDRVAVFGGQGGLADYGCFEARRAVRLPESMSMVDAAAFQIAYGTSHVALTHKAGLKPGETLLVHG